MNKVFPLLFSLLFLTSCEEALARMPRRPQHKGMHLGGMGTSYNNSHALLFGGTNEEVHTIDTADGGSSRFTVAFWVYNAACTLDEDYVAHYGAAGGDAGWTLRILNASCTLRWFLSGNGTTTPFGTTTNAVSTADYVHICAEFIGGGATNADRMKIYFNGVEETLSFSGTIPASAYNTTAVLVLGDLLSSSNGNNAIGYLDEVGLWVDASPPTCASIYNNGLVYDLMTTSPAPDHCWDINNDTIPTIEDRCGSGNGTAQNMEAGDIVSSPVAP